MLKAIKSNGIGYANGHGHAPTQRDVRDLKQVYDPNFVATAAYKETLPDLQNTPNKGAQVSIQHVGIHNFKMPMQMMGRDGQTQTMHCAITGTVSLEAHKKGINMSRIMRTFYEYEASDLNPSTLHNVVRSYVENLESQSARIAVAFDYPVRQDSLRSGLSGYQYYPVVLETVMGTDGRVRQFIHLDFVYSSTCPCSYELSVHASVTRGVAAVPHSQRSVAKVSLEYTGNLWIEDVVEMCREALQTETQVMVKREDEQAFAELNAANLKFVEDAVRLMYEVLDGDGRIQDFRVFASHQESLHSHDAISVIVKGVPHGFEAILEPLPYH